MLKKTGNKYSQKNKKKTDKFNLIMRDQKIY